MANFKLGGHVSVNDRKGFVCEIISDDSLKVTFQDGTSEVVSVSEVVKRRGRPKRVEASTEVSTMTVRADGTIEYRLPNGNLHRTDGPARIHPNGYQAYFFNGNLHRTDGPAVIDSDGYQAYYINGLRHRSDGPAVICADGRQEYWQNGKLHRTDGPARIFPDGTVEYWVDGREYTKDEFEALSA